MGRLVWRVYFTNSPPDALKFGALLVSNHRSSVDPFFVQLAAKRRVHWMVAKEYFDSFVFGPILKAVQAIPTNRSGMDTASTKLAMRITKAGRLVGMFPEGRLNHTTDPLVSIRSGAAVVATRSQVPIIPLLIQGSPYRRTVWSPLFIPGRVAITFGTPIYPPRIAGDAGTDDRIEPMSSDDSIAAHESVPANSAIAEDTNAETLADSDAMILAWGKQVVALAGHPNFPIELASKRRRRERTPKKSAAN